MRLTKAIDTLERRMNYLLDTLKIDGSNGMHRALQEITALNIATKVVRKVDTEVRESGEILNLDFYNEALADIFAAQKVLQNEEMQHMRRD